MRLTKRTLSLVVSILLLVSFNITAYADAPGLPSFPDPVDPQSWELPRDMTWDDWNENPFDWDKYDPTPERVLRGALICVDFPDQPFIITMDKGSELLGNPVVDPISRDEVPQFYEDFLNTPSELNNYRSIHDYWRENSYGQWAIELEGFGPYEMPANEFEYGLDSMNSMRGSRGTNYDAFDLCKEDVDFDNFDFIFVMHAGYDESGVWQEAGEMMFQTMDDVPDAFGYSDLALAAIADPDNGFEPTSALQATWDALGYIPNWSPTRYVPWTSYYAAKGIWSHTTSVRDDDGNRISLSVQGENDGMATFAHEFGHIMSLGDNYNNPYGIPVTRSYTGPWELMSRGSFSGPGGPHTRWMIPSTLGSSSPAPHLLKNSIEQGFTDPEDLVNVDIDELKQNGPVFAYIVPRVVPVGEEFGVEDYRGIHIDIGTDQTPDLPSDDWYRYEANINYTHYDVEVVDRIGYDSFAPDSGVLISKSRFSRSQPNMWLIDAHPEDINLVDFVRPDGTEAMLSPGDMQQLADATFHAGTGEGVVSEYVDEHNRLHFYILDKNYDDEGILRYRVGVRHLDGAEDYERGLEVKVSDLEKAVPGRVAVQYFSITNTGEATDIFRINVENKQGWETMLLHDFVEVEAGETVEFPVHVKIPKNSEDGNPPKSNDLTFTATSETDNEQSESVTVKVGPGNNGNAKGEN